MSVRLVDLLEWLVMKHWTSCFVFRIHSLIGVWYRFLTFRKKAYICSTLHMWQIHYIFRYLRLRVCSPLSNGSDPWDVPSSISGLIYTQVWEMNGPSAVWISGLLSSSMCETLRGEGLAWETTFVVHCAAPALALSGHTDINRALPNRASHTLNLVHNVFPYQYRLKSLSTEYMTEMCDFSIIIILGPVINYY